MYEVYRVIGRDKFPITKAKDKAEVMRVIISAAALADGIMLAKSSKGGIIYRSWQEDDVTWIDVGGSILYAYKEV